MDELRQLFDEVRLGDAATARQQERWFAQADGDDASLRGTLVDLAEARSGVTIQTDSAGAHHGILRLVGGDFCVLGTDGGDVWLAAAGLTMVRPHGDERHGIATGRAPTVDLRLVEALARVAPGRPRLALTLVGGGRLSGELWAVGLDVATVRVDGTERRPAYVSVSSLRTLRSG